MEILSQIQADLLDSNKSLSDILRKAKVLASQIESSELAAWASQELDGYKTVGELPDYRVIHTSASGTWTNGHWVVSNRGVPLFSIDSEKLREHLTTVYICDGIRTVEQFTKIKGNEHFGLSADTIAFVNSFVSHDGYGYSDLHYSIGVHSFEQILDTVRNRLLDFIIKLGKQWNPKKVLPPQDEISQLFSIAIYNNPRGDNVTTIDQRGQQVNYQYNAAGDMNIGQIKSVDQIACEIKKIREEIERAKQSGAITNDIALEAEYNLFEASKEADSNKPNKSTLIEKITKAKDILEDVSEIAGLVTVLAKLIELIPTLVK